MSINVLMEGDLMGKFIRKLLHKNTQEETRDLLLYSIKKRFKYYEEARVLEPESARSYKKKIIIWLVVTLIAEVVTIITRFNLIALGIFIVLLFILHVIVKKDSKNEKEIIADIRVQQREDYKDNADIALEEIAEAIDPDIGPELIAMYLLDTYEPAKWVKFFSALISTILICAAVAMLPGYDGSNIIKFIVLVGANTIFSSIGSKITKYFDNSYKDIYHYDILGSYLEKFQVIEEQAKNKLPIEDEEVISPVPEDPEGNTKTS